MIPLSRFALKLACAGLALRVVAAAEDTAPQRDLPPELAALLSGKLTWSSSVAARAAYGYKDNLLLASIDEERSAFVRGNIELLLLRLPTGPFEYTLFGEAERTHYFSGTSTDHDAKVWIQMEPGYRLSDAWKVSLPVTGYYYDQVFDVTETQERPLSAELQLRGVMAGPAVRWDFRRDAWVEAQLVGQRKVYADRSNDARSVDGAVRVGWAVSSRLELGLGGAWRYRKFDRRLDYSASGHEISDTRLKIREREGEARATVTFDAAARWRLTVRALLLNYQDNGVGYLDYHQRRIAPELTWRHDPWFVRIGGSAGRLDFPMQKNIEVGLEPPSRLKEEYAAEAVVERKLSAHWTVFTNYSWERSRSNRVVDSYTVNEGLLGLRWSWDK